MTFNEAVEALTSNVVTTYNESEHHPSSPTISDLNTNKDFKRAIAYLHKTRKIDYNVIKRLIETKHLYQEAETNNIIFPMYDELNEYVGAEIQGTLSNVRFKGIKPNSKYCYGFNVRFPSSNDDHHFNYALFFEWAVDLLSFIDIKTRLEHKSLAHCILTSMSGLKMNIIKHTLEIFNIPNCVLCVDNDNAADIFLDKLNTHDIHFIEQRPPRNNKDWNEYLMTIIK
jgi:hypothetical protein